MENSLAIFENILNKFSSLNFLKLKLGILPVNIVNSNGTDHKKMGGAPLKIFRLKINVHFKTNNLMNKKNIFFVTCRQLQKDKLVFFMDLRLLR